MRIHVHVPSQRLTVFDDCDVEVGQFLCSTSKFGIGFEPGSFKTPEGRFRVCAKFGDGEPLGRIFKARVATGEIGHPDDPEDRVQTRILWLDGLDAANSNSKDRFIYIHGTNAESSLGTPASHGCVRVSNADAITLCDMIPIGTEVIIEAALRT
jgi:lipoprotein-anchoring transpeptidase ErfK/SrfK